MNSKKNFKCLNEFKQSVQMTKILFSYKISTYLQVSVYILIIFAVKLPSLDFQ